jgi:DNA-binding transcriptional LysR family regulator
VLDDLISDARRKLGRPGKDNVNVSRVNSLFRCVEAGLGLGIIGDRDLQPHLKDANLKAQQLADRWASRNLVCVYPRVQTASPTVQEFLAYLTEKRLEMFAEGRSPGY